MISSYHELKSKAIELAKSEMPLSEIVRHLNGPHRSTVNRWITGVRNKNVHPLYKTSKIVHDYFSSDNLTCRPERFVMIGFLAADGCVSDTNCGQQKLCLNISSKDICVADKFNAELANNSRHISHHAKTKSIQLSFPSNSICSDLAIYGVTPRKTSTLVLPQLETTNMQYYLRGYFYGDGCFHQYPNRAVFHIVANNQFADSLKVYLETEGVVTRCGVYRLKRSPTTSQIVFQGKHALAFQSFIFNDDKMVLLPRKHIS